jgi:hypothetical protein
MKSALKTAILLVISAIAITSCSKKITEANTDPCKGVMCTMLFAMVQTDVTDHSGNAIALDSFYTLRAKTGEKIYHDKSTMPNGYTVLDDGYQKQLVNKNDSFYFVGYLNGKQVVNEPYVIGADCCHIKKQSGKDKIQIP